MLLVVSPAKNLDYDTPPMTTEFSMPDMLDDASELIDTCRTLTPADVSSLMSISDKLAGLNVARYESWSLPFTSDNAKQAMLAFNGDVYTGLDAASFSEEDLDFAQKHLRILSGLYGLLRPLDLMQPYRLEMGTKLATERGKNLYEFWGDSITQKINQTMADNGSETLVNLASTEYFKSVVTKSINNPILTPIFKDKKNGQYKIISFFAKKARGMMARYVIQNKLTEVEQLKGFDLGGYQFSEADSSVKEFVFTRNEQ
ncbi:peroxide stress protein YaaA [Alteromonadaceae bacterium M269]|nr:peroxide stress protein YaaA [Alteromonadaceae bacterium M269]